MLRREWLLQSCLALDQRQRAEVTTVQEEQIERKLGDRLAALAHCAVAHVLESGNTVLIEQAHLAVEDKAATHLLERLDDLRIPGGRVFLLARQELVTIRDRAISVVLELEHSAFARERRSVGREHQIDISQAHVRRSLLCADHARRSSIHPGAQSRLHGAYTSSTATEVTLPTT
jgi:hypothetical protein